MPNVLVYGSWRYFLVEKMIIPRDFIGENVICGKISILSKRNRELGNSVVRESSWLVGL